MPVASCTIEPRVGGRAMVHKVVPCEVNSNCSAVGLKTSCTTGCCLCFPDSHIIRPGQNLKVELPKGSMTIKRHGVVRWVHPPSWPSTWQSVGVEWRTSKTKKRSSRQKQRTTYARAKFWHHLLPFYIPVLLATVQVAVLAFTENGMSGIGSKVLTNVLSAFIIPIFATLLFLLLPLLRAILRDRLALPPVNPSLLLFCISIWSLTWAITLVVRIFDVNESVMVFLNILLILVLVALYTLCWHLLRTQWKVIAGDRA